MAQTTLNGPRNFHGRQYSLQVLVDFGAGDNDITDGVTVKLPPGSVLLSGSASVSTVFGGTSPKLTVKDSSATPVSVFGNVAADAVGNTAALTTGAGTFYPFGTTFTIAVAGGTVTEGLSLVRLEYIQLNRENEVYTA